MTMHHDHHPGDERLAAFADALADEPMDRALAEHVAACGACRATVDELRSLQTALAELSDIAPPRPLRLVPPVLEPASGTGWVFLLRRFTAPAMALAAILIVVGAVGSAAQFGATAASGAAPADMRGGAEQMPAAASAGYPASSSGNDYQALTPSAAETPVPGAVSGGDTHKRLDVGQTSGGPGSGVPYGWLLGFGVVLLAGAFLARGALSGRDRDASA